MEAEVTAKNGFWQKVKYHFTPEGMKNNAVKAFYTSINYVKDTYKTYWLVCLATSIYGLLFVYSATLSFESDRQIIMQCLACAIGYTGALILSTIDYEQLGEMWLLITIVCVFLVGLTFVIGVGATDEADDKAWLRIAGISFQPSELMKIGFMITFSYHLSKVSEAGKINSFPHLILLAMHAMIPVGLIAAQGDHGSAIIFLMMFIITMVCSNVKWYYLMMGFVAIGAMLPVIWQIMPSFQKERIRAVYFPREGDETEWLWQQIMSKTAIGSGGIQGQGLCQGTMTQSQVNPEAHNDFIFAVIGEEGGFIGTTICILLLLSIMLLTLRVAFIARDEMGRYLCISYFSIIATQSLLNIGMCIGVMPVIGIPLPFFSAGGSSTMCLYFGIGLVVSVFMRRNDTTLRI